MLSVLVVVQLHLALFPLVTNRLSVYALPVRQRFNISFGIPWLRKRNSSHRVARQADNPDAETIDPDFEITSFTVTSTSKPQTSSGNSSNTSTPPSTTTRQPMFILDKLIKFNLWNIIKLAHYFNIRL